MTKSQHVYDVRPRKDKRGVDGISDVLPFDRLWYIEPNAISNAIAYAKFRSPVTHAAIRVYDDAGIKRGLSRSGVYESARSPQHPPLRTV